MPKVDYASKGLCLKKICLKGIMPQRDPFKLLCQKGTCLKKICLKGIMPQKIMPQRDHAPKNHAILLHNLFSLQINCAIFAMIEQFIWCTGHFTLEIAPRRAYG